MDLAVEDQIALISRRIRRWREDDDLTLQELAARGGRGVCGVNALAVGALVSSVLTGTLPAAADVATANRPHNTIELKPPLPFMPYLLCNALCAQR